MIIIKVIGTVTMSQTSTTRQTLEADAMNGAATEISINEIGEAIEVEVTIWNTTTNLIEEIENLVMGHIATNLIWVHGF